MAGLNAWAEDVGAVCLGTTDRLQSEKEQVGTGRLLRLTEPSVKRQRGLTMMPSETSPSGGTANETSESDGTRPSDRAEGLPGGTIDAPVGPGSEPNPPVEPMTAGLLARLFGVPLLIVGFVVGCAVVVVLLFGSITSDPQRPVSSLLSVLESSSGEKTAGVLLPRDKELWQVARELALRLGQKEKELTQGEVEEVTDRLVGLLERDAPHESELSEMGVKRFHFVIQALGLTDSPRAVEPIAGLLSSDNADTRRIALTSLARLGESTDVSAAMYAMYRAVGDASPTVRMVACAAVSAVVPRGDARAIDVLKRAYLDGDREVQWNAALGLARLGSSATKSLLLDMLDRPYWETQVTLKASGGGGRATEYPLPPQAVVRYLCATVDACAGLMDDEIALEIEKLKSDASAEVREAVARALGTEGGKAVKDVKDVKVGKALIGSTES